MAVFIPEDFVITEILTRLPAKSLMRFKCVSKNWMSVISGDPSFINAYRRRQKADDNQLSIVCEKFKGDRLLVCRQIVSLRDSDVNESYLGPEDRHSLRIVGSCNGLVCLVSDPYGHYWSRVLLWNPATRQLRGLPAPVDRASSFGFGFDSASRDYKVVDLSVKAGSTRARVFTKSGSVWLGSAGCCKVEGISVTENHIAVDGALYWEFISSKDERSGLLSFDLSDEAVRLVDGPSGCEYFKLCTWQSSLAAFGLAQFVGRGTDPCYLYEAVSSSDSGVRWHKILTFTPQPDMLVIMVWREQFLVFRKIITGNGTMALVDPKAPPGVVKEVEQLDPVGLCGPFNIYDYIETIVSVF